MQEDKYKQYKRLADNVISFHFMWLTDNGWSDERWVERTKNYLLLKMEYMTVDEFKKFRFRDYCEWESLSSQEIIEEVKRCYPIPFYIINPSEDFVLNLNSKVVVPPDEKEYFPFFFFFRLSHRKINEIKSFLDFHLEESFHNDCPTYYEFIEDGILMFEEELDLHHNLITKINRWLEDKKKDYFRPSEDIKNKRKKATVPVKVLFFYYLFRSKQIPEIKKPEWGKLLIKYEIKNSVDYVYNTYCYIGKSGKKDPMNIKNLKRVIDLLEEYPTAKGLAQNDLESLIRDK